MAKTKAATSPTRTFRVWVEQVNQTWVEVQAVDRNEAMEKGYRKWRRECAHSSVSYVEEQERVDR